MCEKCALPITFKANRKKQHHFDKTASRAVEGGESVVLSQNH